MPLVKKNEAIALVRPHPSLSRELYSDWIRKKGKGVYLAADHDLHKLLNVTDLLVSNFSTIMLDALYMRRPVALVHYPDSRTDLPFDSMGFAVGAEITDGEQLSQAFYECLNNTVLLEAYQAKFKVEFAPVPCAPKIAEIINSELKSNRT